MNDELKGSKATKRSSKTKRKEKPKEFKVLIGPQKLTRFEKARIIGARALQLALGAPPFISITPDVKDPIGLAMLELKSKALPVSIRRSLPDGRSQDIPLSEIL